MTLTTSWTRLDHIQLAIPPGSEDECRAYYGGLLGLQERPKPDALAARGGVWFEAAHLHLHCGVDHDFEPARKAHPGLVTRELDALAALLLAHDYDVQWDELLPGRRRFYTHDPFGNRLEMMDEIT